MANKIYPSGNYLIIEEDGEEALEWGKSDSEVEEGADRFSIIQGNNEDRRTILIADSASWNDEADAAYSTATLRTMLRENTGA